MSCDGLVSALHRIRPVAAGKDDTKGRPGGREGNLRQLGRTFEQDRVENEWALESVLDPRGE